MDGYNAHVHMLTSLPERTQLVADVGLNTWICPCIHSLLDIALHQSTYLSGLVTQPEANAYACASTNNDKGTGEPWRLLLRFRVPEAGRTTPEPVPCAPQLRDSHCPLAWRICYRRPQCRFLPDPDCRVHLHQRRMSLGVNPPYANNLRTPLAFLNHNRAVVQRCDTLKRTATQTVSGTNYRR